MLPESRRFWTVTVAGWLLLIAWPGHLRLDQETPLWAALPLGAAFALEFPFYLLPGFPYQRRQLAAYGKRQAAAVLTVSCIAPWLLYSVATGVFAPTHFFLLLLFTALVTHWYVILPAIPLADVLFLALLAALVAFKAFANIYASPLPKLDVSILGHVMLIRTAALVMLCIRGLPSSDGPEYRFWPRVSEWLIGLRYFALLIPIAGFIYWALGLVDLREHPLNLLQALGTFFGILWVTALSEEFFFRGLLLHWIENWTASATISLVTCLSYLGPSILGCTTTSRTGDSRSLPPLRVSSMGSHGASRAACRPVWLPMR